MKLNLLISIFVLLIIPCCTEAQTWSPQTSGTTHNLWAVQFLDSLHGYAAGEAGTVLKTSNGGVAWTSVSISTTYPVRSISFLDNNNGWAVTGDVNNNSIGGQIWMTNNGGSTWTQQTPSTTEARLGISMVSAANGWACGSRNGPLNIDATTNGGTTWVNQSDNNIFGWTYGIDALNTTTAFTVGGAFFPSVTGLIIKTVNGGSTWVALNTGTIPFVYAIDMVNATTGFVVGDVGAILATNNGGTTWSTQTSNTSNILHSVSCVSATNGWTCGDLGTILRTVNGGTNWTADNSGSIKNLNGIFALNTTTAWAVGDSGTIVSIPGTSSVSSVDEAIASVTIFPNPFSSKAIIRISSEKENSYSFIIYDEIGNEVGRMKILSNHQSEISGDGLAAGIYNYCLVKDDNTVAGRGNFTVSK